MYKRQGVYRSKMYVEDTNGQLPAPSYFIANLRLPAQQQAGAWRFTEFARLDNVFDRNYVGSVVVGDANGRYYEPAPGRNWMAGVNAVSYTHLDVYKRQVRSSVSS